MSESRARRRALALTLALVGGAGWSFASSGCLIPDHCILVYNYGIDWCSDMVGAQMWPPGEPQYAEPVVDEDNRLPKGCLCFNSADYQILDDRQPQEKYDELVATIELAARQQCQVLVPAGWDHNCWDMSDQGPVFITPSPGARGTCVGTCSYTCDDYGDPNPYECEELVGGGETTGGGETAGDSETSGGSGGPAFSPTIRGGPR